MSDTTTGPAPATTPAGVDQQVAAMRAVRIGLQRVYTIADRLAGSPGRPPGLKRVLTRGLIAGHTADYIHSQHDRELVPAARTVRTRTLAQLRRLREAETVLTGRPAPAWLDDPRPVPAQATNATNTDDGEDPDGAV